jgi:4-hydroxy-2-oxoheptanedioate aldolase|tara:strand:- start:16 stop:792 length:777 start_codon:yes stop_codon:yes gene_type:complete
MKKLELKEKLKQNKPLLGTWSLIPSFDVFDILSMSGFDFIIACMEHGPFNIETIHNFVTMLDKRDITPIVRVPKLDESYVLRILETGVSAIQVSHISTVEDARKMVKYSKYYPIGNRGLSPVSRAAEYEYGGEEIHTKIQNDRISIIINVEGKEGLNNLPEIAEIDDIDVIFLGIYDISQSLELPGQIYHNKVQEAIEKAADIIIKKGKIAGCFAKTFEDVSYLNNIGVKYITYQADAPIIKNSFSDIVKKLKITIGE